jgi:hypothetical protein
LFGLPETAYVHSSVVSGNSVDDVHTIGDANVIESLGYNLIGTGNAIAAFSQPGDQTEINDPLLGPLQDNGGPTPTHAPLPGSPVIDAGDPAFAAPPYLDQRGYYRVVDGDGDMTARIDIGAVEYASVAPLPGDGNLDMRVDDEDYILWAAHFDDNPADDPPGVPLNGDYNDDGVVNGLDYLVCSITSSGRRTSARRWRQRDLSSKRRLTLLPRHRMMSQPPIRRQAGACPTLSLVTICGHLRLTPCLRHSPSRNDGDDEAGGTGTVLHQN